MFARKYTRDGIRDCVCEHTHGDGVWIVTDPQLGQVRDGRRQLSTERGDDVGGIGVVGVFWVCQ
jgi:hypothetical protein